MEILKIIEEEKLKHKHQYKVIIRTQSAPGTPGERGVQCLRSAEELALLRELYLLQKKPSSMIWDPPDLPAPIPLKKPKKFMLNLDE